MVKARVVQKSVALADHGERLAREQVSLQRLHAINGRRSPRNPSHAVTGSDELLGHATGNPACRPADEDALRSLRRRRRRVALGVEQV